MITVSALAQIGLYNFDMSEYGRLKTVGVTDEWTSCCCCGKQNLKRTVVMQDSNGNYSFFGTTCAYNASKTYFQSKNRTRKVLDSTFKDLIAPSLKKRILP